MKTSIFRYISFLTKRLDSSLSLAEIKQFVIKKYFIIIQKEPTGEAVLGDLEKIKMNLSTLGWIDGTKVIQTQNQNQIKKSSPDAVKWVKSLEKGKVINQGIVANGAGVYLDLLDVSGGYLKGFTTEALESLLRHVEVKRKSALNAFSQDLNAEMMLLEGLAISALFSRAARRHVDLRFLNAALKINDWYFPKLKAEVGGKPLIYYLLALTEQEISAVELLQ